MGELDLAPGAVVGDGRCAYRLGPLIGEGGMGYVWQATDEATGARVALKVLKGGKAEDRKRFQREVRAAAAIHHPNVITVHDFIELQNGLLVIVMDLLEGETLGAILHRDRRISLPDLSTILLPVLSALEAAHALGIVHRDLKPDNVFLCRTASSIDVKVLDFGVAKLTASDGLAAKTQALTGTGSMVGTPYYMSPEQVFADKDLDARADIWSLGIIMYECLTGVRPTEADTVGRVLKRIMVADIEPITAHGVDLPEDVTSLIGRMLSGDREKRPRDLSEIRSVLEGHKGAQLPSFSRARTSPPVDPNAATVPTPEAAQRGPSSVPDTAPSPNRATAGTETSDPVSLVAERPSPTRNRVVAALSLAAVALIGGAVALRATSERGRGMSAALAPATSESTTTSSLAPSQLTSAPTTAASSPAAATAVAPDVVTQAPPVEPARVADATAGRPSVTGSDARTAAATAVRLAPSSGSRVDAGTGAGSQPSCDAREVLSNGHCCPRGLVWQFGRCERPFATTF